LKRPLYLAAALLAVALMAPTAHAGGTRAAQKKRAVEADAQSLEKQLTAPCCYKGTLTDHASGLATKMRADIRTMLAQGKSKKQILAHYKKKYGQAVLVEPPGGGLSSFLLYGVPFGLAFIGLLVMTVLMARKRAPSANAAQQAPTNFQIPPDLDERIDALVEGRSPSPGRLEKSPG
jgi:cytochrome c-type biogenesis protein CcmH